MVLDDIRKRAEELGQAFERINAVLAVPAADKLPGIAMAHLGVALDSTERKFAKLALGLEAAAARNGKPGTK